MISILAMEGCHMRMDLPMLVNGLKAKEKVLESTYMQMETTMKEHGLLVISMDTVK